VNVGERKVVAIPPPSKDRLVHLANFQMEFY